MSHAADAASHLSTPVRRRPKTPEADVENGLLYHPPASPRDWTADDEQREVLKHAGGRTIQEQDADAFVSARDRVLYLAENVLAVQPNAQFWILAVITLACVLVLGVGWRHAAVNSHWFDGTTSLPDAIYTAFEIIVSMDYKSHIQNTEHRFVYLTMLFTGVMIFGVFVGFVTEAVTSFMQSLTSGRTKVVERGHTLVLGWNESTPRLVCQIAFLRRAWRVQNETWARTLLPWLRVPPATPVARSRVVLLANKYAKGEMDDILGTTLAARGISPKRTRIGWDVICRHGDPTEVHDLVRAGAQHATAILLMLNELDEEELRASRGLIHNGGTTRALLALRHLLYGWEGELNPDLRISVQLSTPSSFVDAAGIMSRHRGAGGAPKQLVQFRDLSKLLNSLMFACAVTPGLSRVLLELLNFDGAALRARDAEQLAGGPTGAVGGLVGLTMAQAAVAWRDGILLGVGDAIAEGGGFAGDPGRVLARGDRLLFVSAATNPRALPAAERDAYLARAEEIASVAEAAAAGAPPPPGTTAKAKGKSRHSSKIWAAKAERGEEVSILVCGWREKWKNEPRSLRDRIDELAQQLTPGPAKVIFMNVVRPDEFAELMARCGFERAYAFGDGAVLEVDVWKPEDLGNDVPSAAWAFGAQRPGVQIVHRCADAASSPHLQVVLADYSCDAIIVLGTSAAQDLTPHSADLRVLTILLLLRKLLMHRDEPVHIIGENQEDTTALLALAPHKTHDPDFINTQAIVARALCQSIAFPKMTESVSDLFADESGSASLLLLPCELYDVPNEALEFGVVLGLVARVSRGVDKCAGIMPANNQQQICPDMAARHVYTPGDRLIIISRRTKEDIEDAHYGSHQIHI